MKTTLVCAIAIALAGSGAKADYRIPGLGTVSADEYKLAWAQMGLNAINNCYEGPARSVSRSEAFGYVRVVGDMQAEIISRNPKLDAYLFFRDVMRRSLHVFVQRHPSGWICNYARVVVARVYFDMYPKLCPDSIGCERIFKACPGVERGGVNKYDVCTDAVIEDLARGGYLPVKP